MPESFALGFQSQECEIGACRLTLSGRLPDWLKGVYLRTGPSQFKLGNQEVRHWFDGLAMLERFAVSEGNIDFSCRFLESDAYVKSKQAGKIASQEFATNPDIIGTVRAMCTRLGTDNGNVNVAQAGSHWLALTETPHALEFDAGTLQTRGHFKYSDRLPVHVTTAHPHYDFSEDSLYNIAVEVFPRCQYIVYRMVGSSARREPFAFIPVKRPAYIHSFAITPRYAVLVEFPLFLNPLALIFSGKPYIECYKWDKQSEARIYLVDKSDGSVVTLAGPACFAFHHVNAFEEADEVVVDLLAYADSTIVEALYLDNLRSMQAKVPLPQLKRLRLNRQRKSVAIEPLSNLSLEFPRINYRAKSKMPYKYMYGAGRRNDTGFLDQVVKIAVPDSSYALWHEPGCYPGEPVFVARPRAEKEDDGVVLSVVLDTNSGKSFLLVLDAGTMNEIARAEMPIYMPFALHGWFQEESL